MVAEVFPFPHSASMLAVIAMLPWDRCLEGCLRIVPPALPHPHPPQTLPLLWALPRQPTEQRRLWMKVRLPRLGDGAALRLTGLLTNIPAGRVSMVPTTTSMTYTHLLLQVGPMPSRARRSSGPPSWLHAPSIATNDTKRSSSLLYSAENRSQSFM